MSYKDTLIDKTFPFIDTLLKNYGEFFPIAMAVKNDGTLASVATYDGNEIPLSDDVIKSLKQALTEGYKKGDYVAGAIFYDVRVIEPITNEKKDAVAVLYESANENVAINYFYPYILTKERALSYTEGWNNTLEKEVFVP
ncbi:hypothetical protein QTN47_21860 [Danxiaibacter flavus]|uniref:Uncharacterized protein n=1 Tax=Danxiaibacter flavus TaxID=3049108 RepID=A0ABV3ZJW9_9BACT|nr:hypothetical protein QNM32_21865 [Chitinophagaceae bacterium DXS]